MCKIIVRIERNLATIEGFSRIVRYVMCKIRRKKDVLIGWKVVSKNAII